MPDQLVIYLHPDDLTHPSWVVIKMDGSISNSSLRDQPEGLKDIAEDKEVIVLVPATSVLLLTVNFPKMNRSRLMQALPFALEEQLIGDVEAMHFAVGLADAANQLPVAVVHKDQMKEWLQLLQSFDIKADALVPAFLALPYAENAWSIMLMDETLAVRTGLFKGFGNDRHNLSQLLELALKEVEQLPENIYLYQTNNESLLSSLNTTIARHQNVATPLMLIESMAESIVKLPSLNLLQGLYQVKQSKTQLHQLKKCIAYGAFIWGLLLILYPSISYFILEKKVHELDLQITDIYKRNFPQASSVVAPKIRLQEKLQRLTAGASENHLLTLLGYIGKGLNTSSIKLKRFDFRDNELTLELTAESEDLTAFTEFLQRQGLNVKQQNASLNGSHVNTMLAIV